MDLARLRRVSADTRQLIERTQQRIRESQELLARTRALIEADRETARPAEWRRRA